MTEMMAGTMPAARTIGSCGQKPSHARRPWTDSIFRLNESTPTVTITLARAIFTVASTLLSKKIDYKVTVTCIAIAATT